MTKFSGIYSRNTLQDMEMDINNEKSQEKEVYNVHLYTAKMFEKQKDMLS